MKKCYPMAMASPENGPKGPNDPDRVTADIEASREYYKPGKEYKEYPTTPSANEEAFMEMWDVERLLAGEPDEKTLRKALVLLDTAVAIQNDPVYRGMRQAVLRRLAEIGEKS